jgi:DNA polymerase I
MKNKQNDSGIPFQQPSGKCMIIIDGNHLIHRAFYAIKTPLKTSNGEQANAVYGFASILLNIIDQEKPAYLVLTFDEKGPTFRHEMDEDYKATRTKAPDELYAQIPRIREMVKIANIPIFAREGFEADDLMGTLATKASKHGIASFIVTGDMDALQLVSDDITVVFPHKGYRQAFHYNAIRVFAKYGIRPNQIVDYKALMGDSSDNIKGVEGIGSKYATDLLVKYDTLDGIYKHLDEIPGKLHIKLKSGKEDAYFSQKMARILTDVPCDFNEEKASFDTIDFMALKDFFEKMGMKSLQRRLQKIIPENQLAAHDQMSLF